MTQKGNTGKIDIFLSPSREEGWTGAIDEAAYCGCQVIASKIPGQDENQVPGFYWVGNPNESDISNEMAKKIMDIYRLPESVKRDNIARAKEYMVKNFSMDQWVENILKVYNA